MNRKTLLNGGIIILIIIIAGITLIYNNSNNNINFTNNNKISLEGKNTTINGYNCMIPDQYQNGCVTNKTSYSLYGTDNDSLYITVYSNDDDGDKMYNSDMSYFAEGENNQDTGLKTENTTVDNHQILYVSLHSETRGDYRLAFFKVKDKRVMIEWLGNDINNNIKNIINSFYQLN
ncbi:hypothetical protein BGI41_04775 [Methanobrevibacter sp. 87.7]|uniref:hypothetical protein n=1 Tax=Methanobrevibacter sp. 87.7 TaxID=387957 RepID=UPI000B503CEB|nr:hypothetical protein [Methanobrevibacter sp. 87.7]OWT32989.1 hypothetical protein BGI41_04775 [Methanobrevibacter sp. 87.7]